MRFTACEVHLNKCELGRLCCVAKPQRGIAKGFFGLFARSNIREDNRNTGMRLNLNAKGVEFQHAVRRHKFTFKPDRLAGSEHAVIGYKSFLGFTRENLPDGFADNAFRAGVDFERLVGFQVAKIQRRTGFAINLFDDAKAFVHRLEQRAVALLAGAQRGFRPQAFEPGPDARGHLARQRNLVVPPVISRGFIQAQRKLPLPVPDQRQANKGGNFEYCKLRGICARVACDIAHNNRLTRTRRLYEFLPHEVRKTMNAYQAGNVFAVPVMVDHHALRRFVNVDKCAERQLEMRGHFCADHLHHFVHGCPMHEIPADRSQKLQIQFRLSALGHVARDGEQLPGLAMQVQNRRNRNVPPLVFAERRSETTDETSFTARRRRIDRQLRRRLIAGPPEIHPRLV